jgi:serine/threonine protein kinase
VRKSINPVRTSRDKNAPMATLCAPRRLIRYLASEGIHPREIKGLTELDAALPVEWVFYSGLDYFSGHDTPIQMDLIILMDDRVLLVEIKDWTRKIRCVADTWIVGRNSRRGNPPKLVASKARKLKSLLVAKLPHVPLYVDSCVILTATPEVEGLPPSEARRVLSLSQARHLDNAQTRRAHLSKVDQRLRTPKIWEYAKQFDEVFGDRSAFRPQEAEFDGFRITEENVFQHPRGVWADHRAEENERTSSSALLRCWNFAALPPALNAPAERSFVAERERRVFDHLNALGSWLADGTSVLRPLNSVEGDIATDHFDLLALPVTWTQVPRFIERMRGQMNIDQALDVVGELIRVVAELHDRQIAHRDIGRRNVWLGGAARVGLTGFAICQLPSDESVADWRTTLQAYAPAMPEDTDQVTKSGSGFRRDVYQLGLIAKDILGAAPNAESTPVLLEGWLEDWLATATASDPAARFATARIMADEFSVRRSERRKGAIDQSRLDAFETKENPYAKWADRIETFSSGAVDVYRTSQAGLGQIVVKVWPGIRRNETLELDLALLRLLEGASRLITSPLDGFPTFEAVGLHAVGPFVAYRLVEGDRLDAMSGPTLEEALSLASQLLRAVQSLHALGYAHGDLSPKNIVVLGRGEAVRLTILDLFDLSPAGDGRKRTLAYYPKDHEGCGDKQIDCFAAALIAKELLEKVSDQRTQEALSQLQAVIDSGGVDLLEFPLRCLTETAAKLKEPPAPSFKISLQDAPDILLTDTFAARRFDDALVLTTNTQEITITLENGAFTGGRVTQPSYRSLEGASFTGVRVKLTLELTHGEPAGLSELGNFLSGLPGLRGLAAPRKSPKQLHNIRRANIFPVREYWQRMLEVEDTLLPELEITGAGETLGLGVTFPCEKTRGSFDFDPLDAVDVFIGERTKPIASLDLKSLSDESITLVQEPDWPLKKGDRVRLVSRRSRQSFDKRRRAVDRISRGESQIPDLIEYFDPSAEKRTTNYDIDVTEAELAPYKLNPGQRAAMLKVLREGPVGLVQGPPGTGKTYFLAALVHWLTSKGGTQKILLVSQSHEAVNAALETLIDRFKVEKNALSLLRIGTKGISEKIRPYHTDTLRERFRASFEGSLKHRVATAARGAGIPRNIAYVAVDIERQLGMLSRRLTVLEAINKEDVDAEEKRSRSRMLNAAQKAFESAGVQMMGRAVNAADHVKEVAAAYRDLGKADAESPADMRVLLNLLNLSQGWLDALSTRYRNFDEFLAKTRTIIAGTCVGVGQTSLRIDNESFDWVIIDEAARCTSGELSVAAQLGRRVLLVGDHLQLLPMIDSSMLQELKASFPDISDDVLARSDFERAFASSYGVTNHCVLSEQYRMVQPICDLIAETFYRPHSVKLHTSDEREVNSRFTDTLPAPFNLPISWLDTSSDPRAKELPDERQSHANEAEVAAIIATLDVAASNKEFVSVLSQSKEERPIGIICMYGAQREAIETAIAERLWDSRFRRLLKVETVDSYQGKENTIVIVSLSRTNTALRGGHVSVPNRANVAFSRAKERLIIVGSAKFWAGFRGEHPIKSTLHWVEAREQKDAAAKVWDVTELFGR